MVGYGTNLSTPTSCILEYSLIYMSQEETTELGKVQTVAAKMVQRMESCHVRRDCKG